jgi:hypothetical protein
MIHWSDDDDGWTTASPKIVFQPGSLAMRLCSVKRTKRLAQRTQRLLKKYVQRVWYSGRMPREHGPESADDGWTTASPKIVFQPGSLAMRLCSFKRTKRLAQRMQRLLKKYEQRVWYSGRMPREHGPESAARQRIMRLPWPLPWP